jgi:hypothetical protein
LLGPIVAGWIVCSDPAGAQQTAQAATSTAPPSEAESGADDRSKAAASSDATTHDSSAAAKRSPEQLREARERFDHGLELYRDGDYDIALIEFDRAYELVPDYRVLYNIAQVSVMLGNYTRARLALEQYLREGDTAISPDRRASVEKDLTMLSGRTATLLVTSNVQGAEVLVGEEIIGKTPMSSPALLDAGTHTVTVRLSGYLPASKRLTLAGRDAAELTLELRPVPVKERERIVVEKRVETEPSERATTTPSLVWAGWIATGALAAGAAVTGVLGINAASELETLQDDPEAQHRELQDTEERARSLFLAADLLGAAAVLTGGATLYFTVFQSTPESPPDHDRASMGPTRRLSVNGVQILGRF